MIDSFWFYETRDYNFILKKHYFWKENKHFILSLSKKNTKRWVFKILPIFLEKFDIRMDFLLFQFHAMILLLLLLLVYLFVFGGVFVCFTNHFPQILGWR